MSGYRKILSNDNSTPSMDNAYKTMNLSDNNPQPPLQSSNREDFLQQVHNTNDEQSRKSMDLKQRQQELQDERNRPTRVHISIDDIQQKMPNAHPIHIKECFRIMQSEPTLTLEQAINVANGNGCEMDGFNRMCPSRPIESFRQKGDCVGDGCQIKFNTMKPVKEGFKQQQQQQQSVGNDIIEGLKNLDIDFFSSTRCGFCAQAKDLIVKAGKDLLASMDIKENQKLPEGVRGVPHFVSKLTGKSTTGFPGSLEKLYKALS